ncbi:MAG TPA: hypothetical protein ENI68_08270 [Gammaproteobacteria bacterium]|nr:hypothetical protein [Gammaproteobacteria bacterium]
MILSQAVLEHGDDLESTYAAMHLWLRAGGVMSHGIDFKSHNLSNKWNGIWTCPDWKWKLIRGNRPFFLINRAPHSTHLALLRRYGFKVICDLTVKRESEVRRCDLAAPFKTMDKNDLTISSSYIMSVNK